MRMQRSRLEKGLSRAETVQATLTAGVHRGSGRALRLPSRRDIPRMEAKGTSMTKAEACCMGVYVRVAWR